MSQIEDLLREALHETPAALSGRDPLADVDRRVRQARRRLAAGTGLAVVALAAVVVVPLANLGGSSHRGVQVAHSPTPKATTAGAGPQVWVKPSHAVAVAAGDDGSHQTGIWGLVRGTDGAPQVAHFTPDGIVDNHVDVSDPVDFISVGLGYVWVYGGGDGGSGDLSVIHRVDPRTGKVVTLEIRGKGAPYSMVFTAQSAFVALSARDEVVRVSGVGGPLALTQPVHVPGQPTDMVASGDGTIWVRESLAQKWAQLDVADGRSVLEQTVSWSGPLFGLSHDDTVWTSDAKTRVVEITPSTLSTAVSASYGLRVSTPAQPLAVVEAADAGGVYVATGDYSGEDTDPAHVGLAFYSAADLQAGAARPTARLAGVDVARLAAAPDGGALLVTQDGGLEHWNPQRP